tara:strand:- start:6899 stop:8794 length:1896 start_codon:yes stop_codon:yes gene_type:complete
MAKQKVQFMQNDFVPTFGDEFSSIETPDFKSEIWNTELVNDLLDKVENYGLDLSKSQHPFFDKNIQLRQGRVAFQMTKMELSEFKKCRKDIIHFANTYVQLMTPNGIGHINLYPYQEEMLLNYQKGKNNIVVGSRQIGKTVVAGIFLTWFLIFHPDKNIMLAANKGDTAKEILDKVKSIIAYLPFWLKPGLFSFNMFSIMTDANSRILATTTSAKSAIGFTIHLLFLDEFAHVNENIQRSFWDNIYPVMAADANAKLIITSTPNGYELFQELYQLALEGKNGFSHMIVPWTDVPGRDESWADEQIAIMGEDAFNEQFACAFQRSDLLLLSSHELKSLRSNRKEFIHHQFDILDKFSLDYQNLVWREDYPIENLKTDIIIVSVDLAEGVGKDFTVMQIFKLTPKLNYDIFVPDSEVFQLDKHFMLDQVGIYRDNLTVIEDFAKLFYNMMFTGKMINIDNVKAVVEWNTYGSYFDQLLKTMYGGDLYDDAVYLKTFHRKGARTKKNGIRQGLDKGKNCADMKNMLKHRTIQIYDKWTSDEFSHFTKNKKGSYEASTGHDDTVMAAVNMVEMYRDTYYLDLVAEAFEMLRGDDKRLIQSLVDNGSAPDDSTDFLADGMGNSVFGDNTENMEGWF